MFATEQDRINYILSACAKSGLTTEQIIKNEIGEFLHADTRHLMLAGERYYSFDMDIMHEKIRDNPNRKNNRLLHGFMRKLVDQKTDYLLSKPFSIRTQNSQYLKLLNQTFSKGFQKNLIKLGKEAINKGIAWLQIYFKDNQIAFKVLPSEEIIPLWEDNDHTSLGGIIRVYERTEYEGNQKHRIRHVEYWSLDGVSYYVFRGGNLIPDVESPAESHFTIDGKPYNWQRIPIVPFKYNSDEIPLIKGLKSLIDDYNFQKSTIADLLADIPNFIYVLKNYGGQNLAEFLQDLKESNAIKVDDNGGVDKLQADINTSAFEAYQKICRKDIYEFGRGIDTQNDDLGNASGVAMKFRYADLDMDANALETEFRGSLDEVLWFVGRYFVLMGLGDYTNEDVSFVFNRDIIINESEAIAECVASVGIVSQKTILANHPWVENVDAEIREIATESESKNNNQPLDGEIGGTETEECNR